MSAICSQASGTSIIIACSAPRPEAISRSSASSKASESEPPSLITGCSSATDSPHTSDCNEGPRANIQLRLPSSVLISPLCAIARNGCAIRQLGSVLVA